MYTGLFLTGLNEILLHSGNKVDLLFERDVFLEFIVQLRSACFDILMTMIYLFFESQQMLIGRTFDLWKALLELFNYVLLHASLLSQLQSDGW